MNRNQRIFGIVVVVALALGLGYAGFRAASPSAPLCQVCGRVIHKDMRTVVVVGNRREVLCCPTCALSEGAQLHEAVRFEQLSDFDTGRPLRPDRAFAVEGSDVVPCMRKDAVRGQSGQAVPVEFDRCAPSIISFATRASAERFAALHGGRAGAFLDLVGARAVRSTE
jgi:hypothetical protein